MTVTNPNDTWANAVEAARPGTWRVASSGCRRQTAVLFDAEHLITSQHALHGAERVEVCDDTGTAHAAELVGSDDGLDLALLRLTKPATATSHAPLQRADIAALRVGQPVFALGRPGAQIRASLRIVGLLSDSFRTPRGGQLERYIESDRGLPDGFEGGPLVDVEGRLIGMNSSSVLRGADLSVSHADLTRSVAELVAHGRIRRGYLGVACQTVRLPAALRSALSQRSGALVLDTEAAGPAQAAGLVFGDVIVTLDGAAIRGPRELSSALRDKLGQPLDLGILRNGVLQHVPVTAAERA